MSSVFKTIYNQFSEAYFKPILHSGKFISAVDREFASFRTNDDLKNWITTSDESVSGYSTVDFSHITGQNYSTFSGILSTRTNEKLTRSGYAAIRSKKLPFNFFSRPYFDLTGYREILLRVRGDGRTYIASFTPESYNINDLYQQFIYTRGGPEWETIRLPFEDFLLTNKGYVQNVQAPIPVHRLKHFSIMIADGNDGPYHLDIEKIDLKAHENDFTKI